MISHTFHIRPCRALWCVWALLTACALPSISFAAEVGDGAAIPLSASNCVIRFQVPATWNPIKGEAKQVTGAMRFGRIGDLNTLQGNVEVTVAGLVTDDEDRDQKMRCFCLYGTNYPKIQFELERCTIFEGGTLTLSGQFTLRGITKRMVLGAQYSADAEAWHLVGGGQLKWSDYGIPDPSSFFSKVQPNLKILFELTLPRGLPANR